jgi:16S rRNA (cytosine967-C5)-methyltransferase
MKHKSARQIAIEILNRVEERGAFAEPLLDAFLSRRHLTNIHDRKLLTEIVYGTLRMKSHLDWIICHLYRGDFAHMETGLKNILRTAMYQIRFTDRIPDFAIVDEAVEISKKDYPAGSGLVNAILRNALRKKNAITFPDAGRDPVGHISAYYSHPRWLVERWIDTRGIDETIALCSANNRVPSYVLRVNRLKVAREEITNQLVHQGFHVKDTVYSQDGLIISHPAVSLRETPYYSSGFFQVQDEASQLISCIVDPKPGEAILDICAGTGGKTLHLSEIMENRGQVVALEINKNKVKALQENAAKHGINIVETKVGDATEDMGKEFHEAFDRVLLDAPCSGLGTLRRNPEIKWRIREESPREFAVLQKKLLYRAVTYVKNGGVIIYSTCTVTHEENEEIIDDFLIRHRHFSRTLPPHTIHPSVIDNRGCFRSYPHHHDMDGFFGAVLVKKSDEGEMK